MILAVVSPLAYSLGGYDIDPSDTRCDGFPILPIKTIEGSCAGLVLSEEDKDEEGEVLNTPGIYWPLKIPMTFILLI